MKFYDMICPDCGEELSIEMDPLTEDAEVIECPVCDYEALWEHDAATDTVKLKIDPDLEEEDEETTGDIEWDDEDDD